MPTVLTATRELADYYESVVTAVGSEAKLARQLGDG